MESVYRKGVRFKIGQVIMLVGRSGSGKSALALGLVDGWNLPTLYLSGDMSEHDVSVRIASMRLGATSDEVEAMTGPDASEVAQQAVADAMGGSPITLSSGPIHWRGLADDLTAYVELWNAWPAVIVIDNLMDIEGCEADYTAQMAAMQEIVALARFTGSTVMVLHHATDKTQGDLTWPPTRSEVKGGLSEKPELTLSVALNPSDLTLRVACIKQRSGPSDPTAQSIATLRARPEYNRFERLVV